MSINTKEGGLFFVPLKSRPPGTAEKSGTIFLNLDIPCCLLYYRQNFHHDNASRREVMV